MTTSATVRSRVVAPRASGEAVAAPDVAVWLLDHAAPGGGILAACLGLLVAAASIGTNAADGLVLPVCLVILVAESFLLIHVFQLRREVEPALLIIFGVTLLAAAVMGALLVRGLPELSRSVILGDFTPPSASTRLQAGFANHLLGTGLLIVLTAAFSLPIGVGTGVFLNEYAPLRLASVVRFCTTALRGISVLLLGLTAVSLIQATQDTSLGSLLVGTFEDDSGNPTLQGGSFVLAASIISLLVIPVIARATEEGCRSVPSGLREGSAALGAAEGVTLWRIVLPWALPNIVTSLLLGAAEASGSLATLLFIGSSGVQGVGLLKPVTSLSYALFDTHTARRSRSATRWSLTRWAAQCSCWRSPWR